MQLVVAGLYLREDITVKTFVLYFIVQTNKCN